jgi:hypothetical protein
MSASDRIPWIYDQTHERIEGNVEDLIRLALSQEKSCVIVNCIFAYRHEGMIFRTKFVIVIVIR